MTPATPVLESLIECSPRALALLLSDTYRDYVVPVRFPIEAASALLRQESLDLGASLAVRLNGRRVAVALVARRGGRVRLAALAVVPEARGQGLGRLLLARVLDDARHRGDREINLEVIEGNTAAVELYTSSGFVVRRRLLQFGSRSPSASRSGLECERADNAELAAVVERHGLPDLPWQVSATWLAQATDPLTSFRLGPAWAAVDLADRRLLRLRSLIVEPHARRGGSARRLLDAIEREHPGRVWFVSAHCPEELAVPFRRLGFVDTPQDLKQLHMFLDLDAES